MKFGVTGNCVWFGPPIVETAKLIEAVGFESMWMGEHILIPLEIGGPGYRGAPLPENYRHCPDPIVSMTAAAAVTSRIKLGFDVILLPHRQPLVLAKELATLDRISGGRTIIGFGAGWIPEECEIMGVPYRQRTARTTEYIKALKTLWTEEAPRFEGEFLSFPPIYCYPKPLQAPHPPILIGAGSADGNNSPILRRVAKIGDGWMPLYIEPARIKPQIAELKRYCEEEGRDFAKIDITVLVPAASLGIGERPPSFEGQDVAIREAHQLADEFEAAGVTRIIVSLVDITEEAGHKAIEQAAKGLGL
jgi:probable F420-dependent oxidoreductase